MGSQSKRSFLRASWRLLTLGTKSGEREKEVAKHGEKRFMVGSEMRCRALKVLPRGQISEEGLRSHP